MKKLVLSIMTMAMIVAFVSCEKENLGAFNPKMKIYKVYNETDGHYLQEKWLWNDKQLHKVEYYKKNGDLDQTYLYQYENGLLSSIKTDNQHTDFEYDGKTIMATNLSKLICFLFRNRNCPIFPFRNPPNPRPGQFLTFCTSSPRNWSHIFPNQMQKANVMITVRQKLILHGRKIMSNI